MALLRQEAEKLSNNQLISGVIDQIIDRDDLMAVLPFVGAMVAMGLIPMGEHGEVQSSAFQLAMHMALCGLVMHEANDAIVRWGAPRHD